MIFAVGAVVAMLVFHFVFMPLAVDHGSERAVPRVVGLALEEAQEELARHDLVGAQTAERVNPEWPRGSVLEQDPPPGFRTRPNRTVGLVVSLGRGEVGVPAVEGQSLRHAEMILAREGISVGSIARRPADVPVDQVVSVSPPVGTRLIRGQPVDILISAGAPEPAYKMPDLRGGDPVAVERALQKSGFGVEIVYPAGSFSLASRIVAHSPPAGHRIVEGDKIKLMVGDRP
jgi:serine/threonine-protein kinase